MSEQIASRLREVRKRLGFASQALFAAELGVAPGSIHNYEAGKRSPDAEFLASLAEQGADVLYVLTGRVGSALSPDESALVAGYRAMDERGRAMVLAMIGCYTQPQAGSLSISGGTIGQVVQGDAAGGGQVVVQPDPGASKKRR